MTFIDAALAKLKDTIDACEGHEYGVDLTTLEAKALLARLEAAEEYIEAGELHREGPQYEAWYRAKGEEDVKSKGE